MDRDLPPDPPRRALPPLRRARGEPRRAPAAGGQGRAQRRDDGQLPHDAGLDARGGPRDVHRARAQHRPPARQRRQPAARQPLGLAGGRDARRRRADLDAASRRRRSSRSASGIPRPSCASSARRDGPAAPRRRRTRPKRPAPAHAASRSEPRRDRHRRAPRRARSSGCTAACAWSAGRRARASCSTASPCCCSARTTTWASPTTRACARRRPTRRCAGASAPGASRLVSGTMTVHRRLEERLADFKGTRGGAALRLGLPGQHRRRSRALAGEGEVVFSDELNHASIIDGCRLARAETFVYRHADVEHLAWGLRAGRGPRRR